MTSNVPKWFNGYVLELVVFKFFVISGDRVHQIQLLQLAHCLGQGLVVEPQLSQHSLHAAVLLELVVHLRHEINRQLGHERNFFLLLKLDASLKVQLFFEECAQHFLFHLQFFFLFLGVFVEFGPKL